MVLGKLDSHMQKNESRPLLLTFTNISSKQIKDLTVRPETSRLLEESIVKTLQDIGFGKDCLDQTPKHQE